MEKMPSTIKYTAKMSVMRFNPDRTQESKASPAPMRTTAKIALSQRDLVNQNDFMVAQPWLKGVAQAHVVTNPYSLSLYDLYAS